MNSPDPVPATPPAVIPWYKSAVLRGIIAAVVPQLLTRAHKQFGLDLSLFGVDANMATDWIMDVISAAALAYATKARISKPLPAVALTKASAQKAMAQAASPPPADPPPPPPAK